MDSLPSCKLLEDPYSIKPYFTKIVLAKEAHL